MKLTIEEEKELICNAIQNQVIEYNEYPYIYSCIIFGFYDDNGKRLSVSDMRKFWDKYEVAKTCKFIYNNLKESLGISQIYSFIEHHAPLLDGDGEFIGHHEKSALPRPLANADAGQDISLNRCFQDKPVFFVVPYRRR